MIGLEWVLIIIDKIHTCQFQMQSFTFATLVSAAMAISADELEFTKYAARYNKAYEDVEEFATRLERYMHHDKVINEHNSSNDS